MIREQNSKARDCTISVYRKIVKGTRHVRMERVDKQVEVPDWIEKIIRCQVLVSDVVRSVGPERFEHEERNMLYNAMIGCFIV
jgi:hypothetical protein